MMKSYYNNRKLYRRANNIEEIFEDEFLQNSNKYISILKDWIHTNDEIKNRIVDSLDKYVDKYFEPDEDLHKDLIISMTVEDTIDDITIGGFGEYKGIDTVISLIFPEDSQDEDYLNTLYREIIGSNILYVRLFDIIYDFIDDNFENYFSQMQIELQNDYIENIENERFM